MENFENNKEEGLKLLFIIDKLNEGLHIKEIHGCILLRTTISNIIYYHQIGRAIDAGSNEQRVILDLVSNFNSLKSFNLKKELEEKVRERKDGTFSDCSKEFEIGKFDVVDCVQECVEMFSDIDKRVLTIYEHWSIDEENILKENWFKGREYIQSLFSKRTWNSIQGKVIHLGQIDGNTNWTIDEDNLFKELYLQYGTASYDMMPNRSIKSCQIKRNRLGLEKIYKNKKITYEENKVIIQLCPTMGSECNIYLNNKTKTQVKSRASRLGICLNNPKKYHYVFKDKRINRWYVQFQHNGQKHFWGYFDSEDEAGRVAIEKAKEYGKAV